MAGRPLPDFQIVRLPDFRDISGAEADARVRARAGVVAVEGEHASVRTVAPVAPATHAALSLCVIPVHEVALVVCGSCALVRKQSQSSEQYLGSVADRSGACYATKCAANIEK